MTDDILLPVFYMPMPVGKDGRGPEMDDSKVVAIIHQVWDGAFVTVGEYSSKEEAETIVSTINQRSV